jgi:hypothetical protein
MRLAVTLLALAALGPFAAADKYAEIGGLPPVPQYAVKGAKGKIEVDGKLSEKAWAGAAPITLMFPWEDQTGVKQRTTVRLLSDADYLYVGYECEDVDITATHENRDDPTYKDDCVEIFIRPPAKSAEQSAHYIGLEMNARGVLYDYFFPFPGQLDKSLDLDGVRLKTSLDGTLNQGDDRDRGWTLELALPWKSLNKLSDGRPPPRGAEWRVQINRWDGTEAKGRRLSMWTHSGMKRPNPHNPERFGRLVFN